MELTEKYKRKYPEWRLDKYLYSRKDPRKNTEDLPQVSSFGKHGNSSNYE